LITVFVAAIINTKLRYYQINCRIWVYSGQNIAPDRSSGVIDYC